MALPSELYDEGIDRLRIPDGYDKLLIMLHTMHPGRKYEEVTFVKRNKQSTASRDASTRDVKLHDHRS